MGGNMDDSAMAIPDDALMREGPRLVALLKEMKEGLDLVRSKVEVLTQKVKENQLSTADGISYLEVKHLLLLSYCQSIVYYLLRKAKGLSIDSHPVVRCLVEIRLFLEKIRPIDKKLQYQVQKLAKAADSAPVKGGLADEKEDNTLQEAEDPLKFRPNPDLLLSKTATDMQDGDGLYRPPKFAPTSMDEDKMSKQEKMALRRDRSTVRQAKSNPFMKELLDDIEGRPEEMRDFVGTESRELNRYRAKMEVRTRQEEELFTRTPFTRKEKKLEKHLRKSRNGLLGLTDDFYGDVKSLPLEENSAKDTGYTQRNGSGKSNKRKRKHQVVLV